MWFGNSISHPKDRYTLLRGVMITRRIIGTRLPSTEQLGPAVDSQEGSFLWDTHHPGHSLFIWQDTKYNLPRPRPESITGSWTALHRDSVSDCQGRNNSEGNNIQQGHSHLLGASTSYHAKPHHKQSFCTSMSFLSMFKLNWMYIPICTTRKDIKVKLTVSSWCYLLYPFCKGSHKSVHVTPVQVSACYPSLFQATIAAY